MNEHKQKVERMRGWTSGRLNEQTNEKIINRQNEEMNKLTNPATHELINEQMNRWTNEGTKEQTNECYDWNIMQLFVYFSAQISL